MGIFDAFPLFLEFEGWKCRSRIHKLAGSAGGFFQLGKISFDLLAGDQDQVRVGDLLNILRRRLKLVRVDAWLDNRQHFDFVAADVLADIGRDRGKRCHGQLGPSGKRPEYC